jgi:hypothetical protein
LGRIVAKGEKEDGPEVEVKSNCSSGYSLRFAGFPCSLGAAFALLSSEDLAPVMIDQPEPDHVEHALDASRTAGVDVKRPLRFPMDAEAADKAHCVGEYQNNRYSRPDSLRCVHHQRPVATRLCRGVSSASSIARVDTGRLIAKKYTRWQCRTIAMTAESEEPSDDPSFLLGRLVSELKGSGAPNLDDQPSLDPESGIPEAPPRLNFKSRVQRRPDPEPENPQALPRLNPKPRAPGLSPRTSNGAPMTASRFLLALLMVMIAGLHHAVGECPLCAQQTAARGRVSPRDRSHCSRLMQIRTTRNG